MENPILLVDVNQWQTDLDAANLKVNGVSGAIITINPYTGELKLNPNFQAQYNQVIAAGLVAFAYLVYSPTYTAQQYLNFLSSVMPSGLKTILVDTEISSGLSPASYGQRYDDLVSVLSTKWNFVVYTAEWFLSELDHWPKDKPYWWAQYLSSVYPSSRQTWTWDQLRTALKSMTVPTNASHIPGSLLIWQVTGDRLYLPGSASPLDVNVFYGTLQELKNLAYGDGVDAPPPATTPTNSITLAKDELWYGKVRYSEYKATMVRPIGVDDIVFHVLKINVSDLNDIVFDNTPARSETTWFLSHHPNVQIAINGLDGFVGDYITGFAAYHGVGYGKLGVEQTLFIDKDFGFSLTKPSSIWSACSFPNLLVKDGQPYPVNKSLDDVRARTAVGISQDGKTITVFTVDGGDYWIHHGMNFQEVRQWMLDEEKCWLSVMADGGGSTTLVRSDPLTGLPMIVGTPSGENASGQRSVAVHMGFSLKIDPVVIPPAQSLSGTLKIDGFNLVNVSLDV